jgi:cell division protein FtsB
MMSGKGPKNSEKSTEETKMKDVAMIVVFLCVVAFLIHGGYQAWRDARELEKDNPLDS